MGTIDTAYAQGDDALSYEWQMALGSLSIFTTTANLNVRCTTVDLPAITLGEYTYDFKSETVVKPNGKNATSKEFTTTFRIDKYWNLYNAFKTWSNSIVSPSSGGVAIDSVAGISAIRAPITISSGMYDIDGTFTATGAVWSFTGCWPKVVGNPTLDNGSGDPATTTITWGYLSLK
jgi:hypothetical protein